MTPYILHYAPDNASLIVRLVLEDMQLPYSTVLVDRRQGEQTSDRYRKINPAGMIPAMETPDGVIFETAAILLWLADRHGKMAPPPDHKDRGDFLKWLFFTATNLQGGLRFVFYPHRFAGPDPKAQRALSTSMQTLLQGHLDLLETQAASGWPWLAQDSPSLLDYYVATCMRWCGLYPEPNPNWYAADQFPTLHTMTKRLELRSATVNAQKAEGLGPTPFSAPQRPIPPEGAAL